MRHGLQELSADFDAELWIGAPSWPSDGEDPTHFATHGWSGLAATEFQIAGVFCGQQRFFGLQCFVPKADQLASLGHHYLGSHLPGLSVAGYSTPFNSVLELRDSLSALGLELDPREYARFAEAYLPISAESAWEYAVKQDLRLMLDPQQGTGAGVGTLKEIGLAGNWEDVAAYLTAGWERVERLVRPSGPHWGAPANWTAVLSYPNSD